MRLIPLSHDYLGLTIEMHCIDVGIISLVITSIKYSKQHRGPRGSKERLSV
jgi:hypothetical protein